MPALSASKLNSTSPTLMTSRGDPGSAALSAMARTSALQWVVK